MHFVNNLSIPVLVSGVSKSVRLFWAFRDAMGAVGGMARTRGFFREFPAVSRIELYSFVPCSARARFTQLQAVLCYPFLCAALPLSGVWGLADLLRGATDWGSLLVMGLLDRVF